LWLGWSLSSPKPRSTKLFHSSSTPPCRLIWGEKTSKLMPGMAKVESPVQSGGAAASRTPKNPVAGVTTAPGSNETSIQLGPVILKSGEFQDADSFHKSTGAVTIHMGADGTRLLRFEDSKVTNGPDLHVVLSPYGDPDEKGVKCRKADLEKMQTLHNQCGIV